MEFGRAERSWAQRSHPNVLYRGRVGDRQVTVRTIEAFHGPAEAELTEAHLKGLTPQQRAERKLVQNAYLAMNEYFGRKGEGIPLEAIQGALNMPREAGKTVFLVAHDENGRVLSYASSVHHAPTKTAVLGYIWSHPEIRKAKLEGTSQSLAHSLIEHSINQLKNVHGTRTIFGEIEPFTPREQREFKQLGDLGVRAPVQEERFQELYDRRQRMIAFDRWGAQHVRMPLQTPTGEGNARMNAIVLGHEGLPAVNARNFLAGVRGVQSLIYGFFPGRERQRAYNPMAAFARRLGEKFKAKTFTLQPIRQLLRP